MNIRRARYILLFLALAVLILTVSASIFIPDTRDAIARKMDNPIVDEGFMGWHTISVSGVGSFMIPKEWSAELRNETAIFYNESIDMVVCGYLVDSGIKPEEEAEARQVDAYNKLLDFEAQEIEFVNEGLSTYNDFHNGGYLRLIRIKGNDGVEKLFCSTVFIGEKHTLSLIHLGDVNDPNTQSIAQAMAFSFEAKQ